MRAAAFETILPNGPITSLPISLSQSASRVSPLLILSFAALVTGAALSPYWLIAQHADFALLLARPKTTIPLGLAFIVWMLLFGWPLAVRARQMGQHRKIEITDGVVAVVDDGLFGRSSWTQPLSAYIGIAHHIRASLSGTRHELILVHSDPSKTLLLRASATVHQREIDDLTKLLGCREIAPQVFYLRPTTNLNQVLPQEAELVGAN